MLPSGSPRGEVLAVASIKACFQVFAKVVQSGEPTPSLRSVVVSRPDSVTPREAFLRASVGESSVRTEARQREVGPTFDACQSGGAAATANANRKPATRDVKSVAKKSAVWKSVIPQAEARGLFFASTCRANLSRMACQPWRWTSGAFSDSASNVSVTRTPSAFSEN